MLMKLLMRVPAPDSLSSHIANPSLTGSC
jgi:hypothetical protein